MAMVPAAAMIVAKQHAPWPSGADDQYCSRLEIKGRFSGRIRGLNVGRLELTAGILDGGIVANNGKNLKRLIVALDRPLSDRFQRDAIPDMSGDDGVDQYLRVIRQAAQP